MTKVDNKKLMKKYMELAGSLPHTCETKEELSIAFDSLLSEARADGMSASDIKQLSIALKFFKAIVYRKNILKNGGKKE